MDQLSRKFLQIIIFVFALSICHDDAQSCSRIVYQGPNNIVLTARSMDWEDDIPANIWIFPRGMERSGEAGPNSVKWISKYGSVVASAYDISSPDGLNEKGLVANLLWLAESKYIPFNPNGNIKGLSVAAWAQYVLDNFANVQEVVDQMRKEEFVIVSDYIPGTQVYATLHLSVSDATGDNAIFEYIDGKLVIHHDRSYNVMTNSPTFDKQLALNDYWQGIPGTIMLPGTNRAADRFVRASYYIKSIPQTEDINIAIASTFSVIRNCSVPFGISTPNEPNISSTRWRSLSDQKNLVYYFETVLTPNTFWVDLKKADLAKDAGVKKLPLDKFQIYSGDALSSFVNSEPFKFQGINQ